MLPPINFFNRREFDPVVMPSRQGIFSGQAVSTGQTYQKRSRSVFGKICRICQRFFSKPSCIEVVMMFAIFCLLSVMLYRIILQQRQDAHLKAEVSQGRLAKLLDRAIEELDRTNKTLQQINKNHTTTRSRINSNHTTTMSFFQRKMAGLKPSTTAPNATSDCKKLRPFTNEKRFVVLSCFFEFYRDPQEDCVELRDYNSACACAYSLPLAVAAWRRFDYEAIVFVLSRASQSWKMRKAFTYVIDVLNSMDKVHIFVVPIEQNGADDGVLLKAIRFYGAKYVDMILDQTNTADERPDPYVVAVDVFTQPSSTVPQNFFQLEEKGDKDILITLPAGCCEEFYTPNAKLARIWPASNGMGMRSSLWRQIMGYVDEDDDVIREIRHTVHKALYGINVHSRDDTAADKAFVALFYKWLDEDEARRQCRVEERQMEPSESRVFRLPMAIQSHAIWGAVREFVRAQVNPAGALDINEYFHGYNRMVGAETYMTQPSEQVTSSKKRKMMTLSLAALTQKTGNSTTPPKGHYDNQINFLPLNLRLSQMVTKPYRGLANAADLQVPLTLPKMFDEIGKAPHFPPPNKIPQSVDEIPPHMWAHNIDRPPNEPKNKQPIH